jgi:hypothetical protein
MEPVIDHIEITVKDMDVAVPFYDKLMPLTPGLSGLCLRSNETRRIVLLGRGDVTLRLEKILDIVLVL